MGSGNSVSRILRITNTDGQSWDAEIREGQFGIPGEAIEPAPHPAQLCVMSSGSAYLIDTESRSLVREFNLVTQLYPAFDDDLLLIVEFGRITALGPEGERWQSDWLCDADLRVLGVTAGEILCEGLRTDFSGDVLTRFVVPLATGQTEWRVARRTTYSVLGWHSLMYFLRAGRGRLRKL
jgi:hypothetical protein